MQLHIHEKKKIAIDRVRIFVAEFYEKEMLGH